MPSAGMSGIYDLLSFMFITIIFIRCFSDKGFPYLVATEKPISLYSQDDKAQIIIQSGVSELIMR